MNEPQVFTSVPFDVLVKALAEQLKPMVEHAVAQHVPDDFINQSEASDILGVSAVLVNKLISEGKLTDYAPGNKIPRVSRKEVIEFRKNIVNGRLNKNYIERR